jgi:SPRY domain-containing SOCS box protein 3
MIGVGTDKIDLRQHSHSFVSLIGLTEQSWGLSYCGNLQHNGKIQNYTTNFGQHTVVGVHLDLWSGTLEFYINRKPLGKLSFGIEINFKELLTKPFTKD